eukprot:1919366-Rhodomonas_salina.1
MTFEEKRQLSLDIGKLEEDEVPPSLSPSLPLCPLPPLPPFLPPSVSLSSPSRLTSDAGTRVSA